MRAALAVSLSDADVADVGCEGMLVAALSVAHGTLSFGATTADGQLFSSGANGTPVIAGGLSPLNGAHAQLSYLAHAGFVSEDEAALALDDGGNYGRGGAHNAASAVVVAVAPVNDAPRLARADDVSAHVASWLTRTRPRSRCRRCLCGTSTRPRTTR